MSLASISALSRELATIKAPEQLFPLAATASALAATCRPVGALCTAHAMLLLVASRADDMLDPDGWNRIRAMCARLAAFIDDPDMKGLDALGVTWRAVAEPQALQ